MTTATLKKYRTYLTDENGKPVMVQLDLRNKVIRKAYEEWMEDLEDYAEAQARLKEIKADPSIAISWEDAKKQLYHHLDAKQ